MLHRAPVVRQFFEGQAQSGTATGSTQNVTALRRPAAAYAIVQRAALRAADERAPLRDLLATDPAVAQRLTLTDLDACFDEATFLRHVHEVIARLDRLVPATEASHAGG